MFFKKEKDLNYWVAIVFLSISFLVIASLAFSHGGKHAEGEFTHLQALKKAIELYDQLIEKGKLDQSWENKLSQVDVFRRGTGNKNEIAVSFQRASGDPKTVYIFFNASGKYAGSNFTGE
ncbi:MAG: DUF6488 family protein [Desulfobacterales bacterium]